MGALQCLVQGTRISGLGLALALAMVCAICACSDVGDSSALPGSDDATSIGATEGDETSAEESSEASEASSGPEASTDDTGDVAQGVDSTCDGQIAQEAEGQDAGIDSAAFDVSPADVGQPVADASPEVGAEASTPDSTVASTPDAGVDAGIDAGTPDSSRDAREGEPGTDSAEMDSADSASKDVELDTGADVSVSEGGGGGLVPCTAVGQTGCVSCPNQTNGVCNKTDAAFVRLDIASKAVTAAGPDYQGLPSLQGNCLSCVAAAGCIDFPLAGTTGIDCDDFTAPFTAGNGFSGSSNAICQAALDCVLGPTGMGCAANSGGDSYCYCGPHGFGGAGGTGGGPTACKSNGPLVDGPCLVPEANGFKFMQSDAQHIVTSFADTSGANPSGIANQMLACAAANGCNACLQ